MCGHVDGLGCGSGARELVEAIAELRRLCEVLAMYSNDLYTLIPSILTDPRGYWVRIALNNTEFVKDLVSRYMEKLETIEQKLRELLATTSSSR